MKRIHIYIFSCWTFKIIDFYVTCIKKNVSQGIAISLVMDIRQFKHQTVSYTRFKDSCHRVIKFASVSDILMSGFVKCTANHGRCLHGGESQHVTAMYQTQLLGTFRQSSESFRSLPEKSEKFRLWNGPLAPWLKSVEPGGIQTFLCSDWLILAQHYDVCTKDSGRFCRESNCSPPGPSDAEHSRVREPGYVLKRERHGFSEMYRWKRKLNVGWSRMEKKTFNGWWGIKEQIVILRILS